jgi:hypothetical protein
MKRTIKLIAAVLAATAVGVVAYDRSRAHDDSPWFGSATFQPASVTKTGGYRIEAAPKTVIDLGRNRNGCTLTSAVPTQTVCDIAVAFPDVGLAGTVTFVSSTNVPTTGEGLTIDLGK